MFGPSPRFRQLAARRLVDTISLQTQTAAVATRATMASGDITLGAATEYAAQVREESTLDQNDADQDRSIRTLIVWVDISTPAVAGMRCNVVECATGDVNGDDTLEGRHGTVMLVDRDPAAPVRRLTVEMPNDE